MTAKDWIADADRLAPWHEATVVVAGFGASGFAAADGLMALGAGSIIVLDSSDSPANREKADLLRRLDVDVRLGEGVTDVLPEGVDLVVTSPGWAPTAPLLAQAAARGVPIWGEVELAWRMMQPDKVVPWLGVTGTNGKTTTTLMLASILSAAGLRTDAVGNVGRPIIEALLDDIDYDVLAVELSSFQLHWTHSLALHSAAVLNLHPDHLEWYADGMYPPMHIDASPYSWPPLTMLAMVRAVMIAPVAPMGWPHAIAPPSGFTFASSSPRSRMIGIACAANASFNSIQPSCSTLTPLRSRIFSIAGLGAYPMISGSMPTLVKSTSSASGVRPRSAATDARVSTIMQAPSLMPDALPAVTLPSASNTGRIPASFSSVRPARGCSSTSTTTSPRRPLIVTGVISSATAPEASASWARRWLSSANASCSSRLTPNFSATFSAVMPIGCIVNGSVIIELVPSISLRSPSVTPARAEKSRNGCADMFSVPPAMTMSDSPTINSIAASPIACIAEPHSRFTVIAVDSTGAPASRATRRLM